MIAELAAANAAFDVIKQSIQNGREIYEAGEALAKYFGLKAEITKKAHQHGYKSDIAAFMASEQLNAKEAELKEMMIYQGRGGMWDDWVAFQAEMKRSRDEEARQLKLAKAKRKQTIIQIMYYGAIVVLSAGIVATGIFFTMAATGNV
jgi:predicted ATPase